MNLEFFLHLLPALPSLIQDVESAAEVIRGNHDARAKIAAGRKTLDDIGDLLDKLLSQSA